MATAIQRRRGNTSQHANFTGLAGEITIDTEKNTVVVHDGSTAGGFPLARSFDVEALGGADITAVIAGDGLTGGATVGNANINVGAGNGITVTNDAVSIDEGFFDQTAGGTGWTGNIVPSVDNVYSLGSADRVWKDVYVGPGSLYVNGQKVLEDNSGTIVVSADEGQNLAMNTKGGGDIEFNAIGGGTIALKSNVVVSSGISFSSAGGNTVGFNSNINMTNNQINNVGAPVVGTDAANKTYVDTASDIVRVTGDQTIAGAKTFSDNMTVNGDLTVTGTTTTVNSETISLADNIIDLNSNFTSGSPTENAGIRIQRGDDAAVQLRWNESDDHWEVYDGAATTKIALDTDDLAEGTSNLYFTDARARGAITTSGDLSYDSATGTVSFTERTDAQVRALFSASGDLSYDSATGTFDVTTYTDTDARSAFSVSVDSGDGDLSYNVATGVITYTGPSATEVRAHFSVSGDLSYNSSTGVISYTGRTDAEVRNLLSGGTGIDYNSATGAFSVDGTIATKTYADTAASSAASAAVSAVIDAAPGTLDTLNELAAALGDDANFATTVTDSLATKYDSADFNSDFDTRFASKGTGDLSEGTNLYYTDARVDARIAAADTDDLTEGSSNLYFTDERARNAVSASGSLNYNSSTGVVSFTERTDSEVRGLVSASGDLSYNSTTGEFSVTTYKSTDFDTDFGNKSTSALSEGTNLYYTDARARAAISAGGDLSYNSTTGTVSFTERTDSEVTTLVDSRVTKAFVDNLGVDAETLDGVDSASFARKDQAETFAGDITVQGNLTITGTQTVVNTETLTVDDNIIVLNNNEAGAPSQNAGIEIERGTADNVSLVWDEADDKWSVGAETFVAGTFEGNLTGDVTGTVSDISNHSTTDLSEGTNLYFTDARARSAVSASGDLSYNSTTGTFSVTTYKSTDFDTDFGNKSTTDLSEGINLYFTDARARTAISASGDLSYNSTTGIVSFTERTDAQVRNLISGGTGISYNNTTGTISLSDTGYVTGVTAGTGLTGGGTEGTVTLNVSGLTLSEFADAAIQDSGEVFADVDTALMTAAAIEDRILSKGYTTNVGDITGVTAGSGLTGGGASGSITLNIGAGTGISVAADAISVSGLTLNEFDAGAIQTSADGFADNNDSLMTSAMIDDHIRSFGYTTNVGDITGVTAGTGLTGGGASGSVTLNVSGLTVSEFSGSAIQTSAEAFADSDAVLMTAAAIEDRILGKGYSTTTGTVTSVGGGSGLTGSVTSSGSLAVGAGSYIVVNANDVAVDATSTNTANKVVARDGSGNFSAGVITATATNARYADLAEMYAADADYEPGTVVCFGGDAEVTACGEDMHHSVAGVVSTNPAYLMNTDTDGVAVALTGRVPCKVTGPVNKGDLIVSSSKAGYARAENNAPAGRIIGKAIGSSEGGETVIEVLVNMM